MGMKQSFITLLLLATGSIVHAQSIGAGCTITAVPQSVFSGSSVQLTLVSSNVFSPIVFDGKEYISGSTVTVTPSDTTTYSASVAQSRSCTNTVVVSHVSPLPAAAVQAISAPSTSPEQHADQTICVSDTYKFGDTHEQIKVIQAFLHQHDYKKVKITGVYDEFTKRAVAHFQNEHAIDILIPAQITQGNGVWGFYTAKKASGMGLCALDEEDAVRDLGLEKTPLSICYALPIAPGDKGDAVRSIQKFLRSQGYAKVEVTGYYGPATRRAVTHFQNEYRGDILNAGGYRSATGVWGPLTAAKASELGLCAF